MLDLWEMRGMPPKYAPNLSNQVKAVPEMEVLVETKFEMGSLTLTARPGAPAGLMR